MAKEELFRVPVFGALIRSLDAFPVKRGAADMEAIRLTLRLLEEDRALLVFPEGTRGDGRTLLPFNRGVAMLAKRSGAAVLPAGIVGTHKKMPRGRWFPWLGRTTVTYGAPLRYAEFETSGPESEAREAFSKTLEERLIELCRSGGLELRSGASNSETRSSVPSGEAIESRPRG
jgi:1-acyl-sn-glycerol-3-phosphate acyltransferase